jgi:hypothetical protein
MTQEQKLERFAETEFRRNMHNLIVQHDGVLVVFGHYKIVENQQQFEVHTYSQDPIEFSSKRTALSWCIADYKNRLKLANNILTLDRKKRLLASDIHCRKTMAERSRNNEFNDLVITKIQPKIDSYQAVNSELEKCVNQAKYIQIKGFNNETARTGLT